MLPANLGISLLVDASLQSLPPLSCSILPLRLFSYLFSSSYEDTSHVGLGISLTTSLLTWLHLRRPIFQNRPHSQALEKRVQAFNIAFGKHNSIHNKSFSVLLHQPILGKGCVSGFWYGSLSASLPTLRSVHSTWYFTGS